MEWQKFQHDGQQLWSGDASIDEFSIALLRIRNAYLEQFKRKPLVVELMYAFGAVLAQSGTAFVEDPETLETSARPFANVLGTTTPWDLETLAD